MTIDPIYAPNTHEVIMARETAVLGHPHNEFLSRRDVAARFGVAPQTITRWANEGILPCVWTLGGQRRYPASEVERLVSAVRDHGLLPKGPGPRTTRAPAQPMRKAE